jgi:ribosomal protein S6--L-glutamate ligase
MSWQCYDNPAFIIGLETLRYRVKIAILSRDGTLYSCKRLREAASRRGHVVEIIDPLSCYMNINPAAPSVHYKGRQLPHYDAVIPRIGSAITFYGTAVLRQFEMLGSYPLNESVAITRARDKLRSLQLMARQGIDLPVTGFAHSPDDTSDLIDMVGGAPLVVKLVEGTQGIGVVLAETRQAAESVIDAFRGLNAHILVQEYIKEAKGRDIRCLVVGNKVVAAIERQAKPGDFRSNLHRGGVAHQVTITEREREIALHAAATLGLDVAGVDILRAKRGPLVMEVNASPGLEGIEKTSGIDIATLMIKWIEQQAQPGYCLKTGG